MDKIANIGLIGCGHIAETYFRAEKYFNNIKIIKCADINAVSYTHLTLPTTPYV